MTTNLHIHGQIVRAMRNEALAFSHVEIAHEVTPGCQRRFIVAVPTSRLTAHPGDYVQIDAVAELPDARMCDGQLVIDTQIIAREIAVV